MSSQMIVDPVAMLREDQRRARDGDDPQAGFATLATETGGQPAARVVTMRQIGERRVLVSANATSPKARALADNPRCELVVFWTSLQRQYRLTGHATFVPAHQVPDLYRQVPWRSKAWDYVYEAMPQSTTVAERGQFVAPFVEQLAALQTRYQSPAEVPATRSAGYIEVAPTAIEVQTLDLTERLHERLRYQLDDAGGWSSAVLVP